MKNLNELRAARKKLNKHLVIIRITNAEEEKMVKILEDNGDSFTAFVSKLVKKSLGES